MKNKFLLQLVLRACVAAVKYRPVLHHVYFWYSGIYGLYVVYIWK